jgi:hypothetical protein
MADSDNLLETMTSSYANARGFLARANAIYSAVTFKIARGKPEESIADLAKKFRLDASQQQTLFDLAATKGGPNFIDEKVQDMNRAAFHRSAFALNAFAQLFFVDLPSQVGLSFVYLKLALVLANVALAIYAHVTLDWTLDDLIAGPNALPPKRRFFGLAVNPRYNKAVKNRSRPYAREAWKEKNLFRTAYFINAGTIFFGTQFIVPLERLIFPFGMLFGKIIGLIATALTAFDIWRGVKAGDDARVARERDVSVYRDLNI